jgi:PAS domain S-box-containing protein
MAEETNFLELENLKSNYYKYFFEHSYDFTCIANTEGYFEIINPNFLKSLGYNETELLTKRFVEFIHPEDVNNTMGEIEKLKKGATTINFINKYRKKDGNYIWLEWNASPDKTNGKIYAIARDITQRAINQNIIKSKTEILAQANNELEQFVYFITHNLQKPLEKLNLLTSEIKNNSKQKLEDSDIEKINFITIISNNIIVFADKLLLLTRIGKNKIYSSIDCNLIIELVKRKLENVIHQNKAIINVSKLPCIKGNAQEIEELFFNLLLYTIIDHEKETIPEITISIIESEEEFLFEIKTNAKEIENKFENSIFLILTSIDVEKEYFDSDLSFLICKKIVVAHNGKIWIESILNQDSRIFFTIAKKSTKEI